MIVENRIARDSTLWLRRWRLKEEHGDANVEIVCAAISVLRIREVIDRMF